MEHKHTSWLAFAWAKDGRAKKSSRCVHYLFVDGCSSKRLPYGNVGQQGRKSRSGVLTPATVRGREAHHLPVRFSTAPSQKRHLSSATVSLLRADVRTNMHHETCVY